MYNKTFLFILIFMFSNSLPAFSQTESRTCRIKTMIGSVKIRRNGTVNWMNARVGMPLREKDGIRTFVESEAELETSEGTIMKVGENSTLELSKFMQQDNTQNTKVKIMNGNVISNVKKLVNTTSSFEFETPTATAAIRGTIVGLDVNKNATNIKVYEGRVFVTPNGSRKGIELIKNQMSTITAKTKAVTIELFSSSKPISDSLAVVSADSNEVIDTLSADTLNDSGSVKIDTIEKLSVDTLGLRVPEIDTIDKSANIANKPLKLTVTSPAEGSSVTNSTQLTVTGMVSPSNASVIIDGKKASVTATGAFSKAINTPAIAGHHEITINAELDGTSQTLIRSIKVKLPELVLSVINPKQKQSFSKPLIPVSGTVSPGSQLTIMSMKIPVTSMGSFNTQIPIPNEEGEYTLEFEASLEDKTQRATRTIIYKPEYRFVMISPQDRQIINTTLIQIKGEVLPTSASIRVQGKKLPVTPQGTFSGLINIPDQEGEVVLDFEIITGGISKNERKTVTYKRPPDTYIPLLQGVLPLNSQISRIPFTVIDRTIDEEITFVYEIDGSKESQTGQPNSPFYVTLIEGIHNYKVYAIDKKGNRSQTVSQTISYLGKSVWNIRLRKPTGDMVLNLPPSTPDGNYKPKYTIEFSIEDLPDQNIKMLKEISVFNSTTSEKKQLRNLTDTYFETELVLSHSSTNVITIEAIDVNNNRKNRKLNIHVR